MSAAAEVLRMPESSEAEFIPLFRRSPVGVALCQPKGTLAALNPALEQLLGLSPANGLILKFSDMIHPEDRFETDRLISELAAGQRDSFQIDSKTPGAESRLVRWTAWKVQAHEGSPGAVLAMAEEFSDSTTAEQRLRRAQRLEAVGRLAGGVAHDFNNLLTGVLLYCDLLIASLDPEHRARKYAEEIRKAGFQATGIVRQLLALARPTNSQPRLLSLNEIAEGMRNLLVRLIGENVELKFNLDPNLGLAEMDPAHVQQILLNLVLNARDAMPEGGQISIKTANCKIQILPDAAIETRAATQLPCVLFVVSDNGFGMDDSTRSHLFEPFFTTKAGRGTGLGLATVHDIVTSNGGLIFVESKPGEGTQVSVLLPQKLQEEHQCNAQGSCVPGNGEQHSSQEEE